MKNRDIVDRLAGGTSITKRAAEAAVGAVFGLHRGTLARGGDVTVTGFGRFTRIDRPACEGRNPSTGERVAIDPSSGVSFNAEKALRDELT